MKINLAKSAGFCFGVKRAIGIALREASVNKEVCMLKDIVHNEDVVRKIKRAGIKKIDTLSAAKGRTLVISAHGAGINTLTQAKRLGFTIVDATCPMVKEIHKIAKDMDASGYFPIIIGDKKHDEVLGIIGQLKQKAVVIENPENIPFSKLKGIRKAFVVAQSTQNSGNVRNITARLKQRIPGLRFFNTICLPTRTKQDEIRKMPGENDVMIIIGSRKSANTKRLYEISRLANKKSYWINSALEIKNKWFKGAKSVGVTAGASTPEEIIREVVSYLSNPLLSLNLQ